jgi:hypothetical protein
MLIPQLLRTLHTDPAKHPRAQAHLSAASGLALIESAGQWRAYVVADDEHHMGRFKLGQDEPVKLMRTFPLDLPLDAKKRKALKPDLEALCRLPVMPGYAQGALLALGSGSKEARHHGLLMAIKPDGKLNKDEALVSRRLDLNALYAPLHAQFADLNIEGCFIHDDNFCLVQRGNKAQQASACISFHSPQIQAWLSDDENPAPLPSQVMPLQLEQINGIPLTPTDGLALPDGNWLFSAVAENTQDSFHDGPCVGSALAVVSPQGKLLHMHALQGAPKVEGICLMPQSRKMQATQILQVLMVTDADDPAIASQLLLVQLG